MGAAAASARASTSNSSSSSGQTKISNFFSGPFRTEHPRQPSAAAAAAINRQSGRGSTPGGPLLAPSNPNAGMSEDEALAAALAASMADNSLQNSGSASRTNLTPEEEEDRMLAQALQESERLARQQQGQGQAAGSGDKTVICSEPYDFTGFIFVRTVFIISKFLFAKRNIVYIFVKK